MIEVHHEIDIQIDYKKYKYILDECLILEWQNRLEIIRVNIQIKILLSIINEIELHISEVHNSDIVY